MKIESKKFCKFLKAVKMEGGSKILEVVIDFNENGVQIKGLTVDNITFVSGILKKDVFKEYEPIGKIGIQDLEILVKILEKFDEPEIKVEGNLLSIKEGNKRVDIELIDIEFIKDIPELKLDYNDAQIFEIDAEELKNFIKDVIGANGKNQVFIIETLNKQIKLSNEGKYKFTRILPATVLEGTRVVLSSSFIEIITNLDGMLTISMKNNYPVKIISKTDESVVTFYFAPRIDNENGE